MVFLRLMSFKTCVISPDFVCELKCVYFMNLSI
ncbi:DUF805 domain-containing protein, partial [Listeria monocytogenes]|nr:DUF805 domain-containing protein [Listeria monocytogenes]